MTNYQRAKRQALLLLARVCHSTRILYDLDVAQRIRRDDHSIGNRHE